MVTTWSCRRLATSLPFFPEIGSNISRWPSVLFVPFLIEGRPAFGFDAPAQGIHQVHDIRTRRLRKSHQPCALPFYDTADSVALFLLNEGIVLSQRGDRVFAFTARNGRTMIGALSSAIKHMAS